MDVDEVYSLQSFFCFSSRKGKMYVVNFFILVFQKERSWISGLKIKHYQKPWARLM